MSLVFVFSCFILKVFSSCVLSCFTLPPFVLFLPVPPFVLHMYLVNLPLCISVHVLPSVFGQFTEFPHIFSLLAFCNLLVPSLDIVSLFWG